MNETIMLCFRDLVTDPGETVSRHAELIRQHGYCWWGWWKKQIEDVPVELLIRLVKSGGAAIFLYDCGRYKLFEAYLSEVAIAPSDTGMSSTEVEKTPEYYAGLKCGAWFKLTRIAEVADAAGKLRRMSYIDFPTWRREATHEAFKGQMVSSFEELDGMQVTFWHVSLNGEKASS